jgi:adenosylcobinamide-GDP ribazoletransferase
MREELKVFFTALMYFSRIPVPRWVDHSESYLTKATRYFPVIGWIVGLASALVFYIFNRFFGQQVAAVFALATGILVTGAFHEDGFADVCDGFGGGWTKEKILVIMKDSRVGAFGAIGIMLLLLTKFSILSTADPKLVLFMLLAAHPFSRFAAATFLYTHTYVRPQGDGLEKPGAKGVSIANLLIACFFGILPMLLWRHGVFLLAAIPVFAMRAYLGYYFKKWIGGYTGDCLGAAQQVFEVVSYLSFILIWKFI